MKNRIVPVVEPKFRMCLEAENTLNSSQEILIPITSVGLQNLSHRFNRNSS